MGIAVREFDYTYKDANAIKNIDSNTFKDCNYDEEKIIEIAKKENNKIYIAEVNNKAIGFISLIGVQTLHYKGMWVDLIAVHPDYQGQGIAKQMLNKAKEFASLLGVDMVSGLVANKNLQSRTAFKGQGYDEIEKDFRLYVFSK